MTWYEAIAKVRYNAEKSMDEAGIYMVEWSSPFDDRVDVLTLSRFMDEYEAGARLVRVHDDYGFEAAALDLLNAMLEDVNPVMYEIILEI